MNEITFYSDIDLNFVTHPFTGDVSRLTNINAIIQSIKNIVRYEILEKPFNYHFHTGITEFLFSPASHIEMSIMKSRIEDSISRLESRIKLTDVDVKTDSKETTFIVTITFKIRSLNETQEIKLFLQRVR